MAARTMESIRSSFVVVAREPAAQKSALAPIISLVDDDGDASDSTVDLTKNASTSSAPPPLPAKQKKRKRGPNDPMPAPRKSLNEWLTVSKLAEATGVHSVTTVDPGTRNFALMRVEFFPVYRITHVRVLDLHELCDEYEETWGCKLSNGSGHTIDAMMVALQAYIEQETLAPNGCFNSSMTLVEEQSFSREMTRVEQCVHAVVNAFKDPVRVGACSVPPCQVMSAKSYHSLYRPFFPDFDFTGWAPTKKRPFGMGDANRNERSEKQRLFNKENSVKYGSLILSQARVHLVLPPANLTEADRKRVLKRKCDDMFDTMWMMLYFASTYLAFYNKKNREFEQGKYEPFLVTAAPLQRPHNCWEEVFELCAALGTPSDNVQKLVDKLLVGSGEKITVEKL
jgi:hypothetical protein